MLHDVFSLTHLCGTTQCCLTARSFLVVIVVADLDQSVLGQRDEQEVDLSVHVHVCVSVCVGSSQLGSSRPCRLSTWPSILTSLKPCWLNLLICLSQEPQWTTRTQQHKLKVPST